MSVKLDGSKVHYGIISINYIHFSTDYHTQTQAITARDNCFTRQLRLFLTQIQGSKCFSRTMASVQQKFNYTSM